MKTPTALLLAATLPAVAQVTEPEITYVNFIRQYQRETQVVWDMPVNPVGSAPSALALESGGSLFQLWTIEQPAAREFLLDQKLVGAYLPSAEMKVSTTDPYGRIPRTRVDQPFTVEINVSGLISGPEVPLAASSVLLQRFLGSYGKDQSSLDPAVVTSKPPYSSGYISQNGATILRFGASALTAPDPLKVSGEEHFLIKALTEGAAAQTQLSSTSVQIWPVATGAIKGISNGDHIRIQVPELELLLNDLYPRSDTHLLLFEGSAVAGVGTIVKAFPMDREKAESHVITVTELGSKLTKNGTFTLALFSDTVFGHEMLCDPITFTVDRTIYINTMMTECEDQTIP